VERKEEGVEKKEEGKAAPSERRRKKNALGRAKG